MDCNSGQRKVFADEIVARVTEIVKKHGLDDVVVQRDSNPVLMAARGCLKSEDGDESVEFVLRISPDLSKAEQESQIGARIAADVTADVSHAFDLSDVVAKESVAMASDIEDEKC
jgi:hypothetical protein